MLIGNAIGFKKLLLLSLNPAGCEKEVDDCFLMGTLEFQLLDLFFNFHRWVERKSKVHNLSKKLLIVDFRVAF